MRLIQRLKYLRGSHSHIIPLQAPRGSFKDTCSKAPTLSSGKRVHPRSSYPTNNPAGSSPLGSYCSKGQLQRATPLICRLQSSQLCRGCLPSFTIVLLMVSIPSLSAAWCLFWSLPPYLYNLLQGFLKCDLCAPADAAVNWQSVHSSQSGPCRSGLGSLLPAAAQGLLRSLAAESPASSPPSCTLVSAFKVCYHFQIWHTNHRLFCTMCLARHFASERCLNFGDSSSVQCMSAAG